MDLREKNLRNLLSNHMIVPAKMHTVGMQMRTAMRLGVIAEAPESGESSVPMSISLMIASPPKAPKTRERGIPMPTQILKMDRPQLRSFESNALNEPSQRRIKAFMVADVGAARCLTQTFQPRRP